MNGSWSYASGRYHIWEQRSDLAAAALLLLVALACGGLLAAGVSATIAVLLAMAFTGLLGFAILWRWPVLAVYLLVFGALFIDQWPVQGLHPFTTQTHLFETLSGFTLLPIPITPAEMILGVALLAVVLPTLARRGAGFYCGSLFVPVIIFLLAELSSGVFGAVRGAGTGPFWVQAAWAEARSFVYLSICYVLAANLITTRYRLRMLLWVVILAIGLKRIQGIGHFLAECAWACGWSRYRS